MFSVRPSFIYLDKEQSTCWGKAVVAQSMDLLNFFYFTPTSQLIQDMGSSGILEGG